MPRDNTMDFAKEYAGTNTGRGKLRNQRLNLSELELLLIDNAEVRGFLNSYMRADHLTQEAREVLWLTQCSFFRPVAGEEQCTLSQVAKSLKKGPGRIVLTLKVEGKPDKEDERFSSTRQFAKGMINDQQPGPGPDTLKYKSRTEQGKRLQAQKCEWCEPQTGTMEAHQRRKPGNLTGKSSGERQMIQRRRQTMVLCVECYDKLYAGKLKEKKRMHRENGRAGYLEIRPSGSEGSSVKPGVALC